MGTIRKFNEYNSAQFVKPSKLSEFGVIHIEYVCVEDWCDNLVFYFTKKDDNKRYKSIANYQLTKISEYLSSESSTPIKRFEIDDYGRFIEKESKGGKKYNWFVLE